MTECKHGALKGRARILIVDDQESNVEMVKQLLAMEGYENVHATTESTRFMEMFREIRPDAILLDLEMPPPDGFALLAELERYRKSDFTPVMVLTGHSSADVKRRAFEAGATDFLNKPFHTHEVIARLQNLLALKDAQRQLEARNVELAHQVQERTKDLADALERLRTAESVRATILGNLSHELRTPLTPILGWSQMIARGELDEQRVKECGETIFRSATRLSSVVDCLLATASPEARDGSGDELADAAALLDQAQAAARRMGRIIEVRSERPLIVRAPAPPISSVLDHLIDNAFKFSPPGSTVVLSGRTKDDMVSIAVIDQGPGFPQDHAYLLDPFTQADPGHTREHGGVGVGLYLANSLVRSMGGGLTIANHSGGAMVVFELPGGRGADPGSER